MAHMRLVWLVAALPFLAPAADQPDPCSAVSSVADVQFTLSLKDHGSVFQEGEIVPVELAFTSSTKGRYTASTASYDRSGRLGIDLYCVEPHTPDPLAGYFKSGGLMGGGLFSWHALDSTPWLFQAELNEWHRLAAGHYRVYAISHRVSRAPDLGEQTPYAEIGVVVRSNTIDFDVSPADPAWQAAELTKAVGILAQPSSPEDAKRAARVLRFLDTRESAVELARLFWGLNQQPAGWEFMFGLYGSPFRQDAIDAMHAELTSPGHAVTSEFLHTLVGLQIQSDPAWDPPKYDAAHQKEAQAFWERRRKHESELTEAESRTALGALGRKTGAARALTVNGLLQSGTPDGALAAALRPVLVASWDELPRATQDEFIQYRWPLIAGREMLPILRRIVAAPPAPSRTEPAMVRDAALQHLFELDPAAGREAIRKDLLDPQAQPAWSVLTRLPKEDLVSAVQAAVDRITAHAARDLDYELVERYGDEKPLANVQHAFEEHLGQWACIPQSAMLRYFIREAPDYGAAQVKASLNARKNTGCFRWQLQELGAQLPKVQQIAIDALDDPDPDVQQNAAGALGRWGTAEAEPALWARLERFHAEWADRKDKLRPTRDYQSPEARAVALERMLVSAIGAATNWVCPSDQLKRLQDLVLTSEQRRQVEDWIQLWKQGSATLQPQWFPEDTPSFSVLHYQAFSEDQLRAKVTQFPPGFVLHWQFWQPGQISPAVTMEKQEAAFERVRAAAAEHGLNIDKVNYP